MSVDDAEQPPPELTAEFDPMEIINKQFPTEESLVGVDGELRKLKSQISHLDEEILLAVRQQATCGSKAKEDLGAAQRAIAELSSKICDIKKRAEQSEVMVEEICKDIRKLDHGKRNLTTSINTLKRLQMIMAAVEQLKELSVRSEYGGCADLLEVVGDLANRFEMYKRIPKVRELLEEYTNMKQTIRTKIFELMDELEQNLDEKGVHTFQQACRVISALKDKSKDDMVARFSTLQTAAYKSLYRPGLPAAALEKTERRFGELRKILQLYHSQFEDIFPLEWAVPQKICEDFCRLTRSHLKTVLEKAAAAGGDQFVGTLLHVLQKTIDFEQELGDRYQEEAEEEEAEGPNIEQMDELEQELQSLDTTSTQGIRRKYELLRIMESRQPGEARVPKEKTLKPSLRYRGLISDVFENYLDYYISAEEKNMRAMVLETVRKESWMPQDSITKFLDSSAQMFLAIRESLKRCHALNKPQAMYDLHQRCFRMCLQEYANALKAHVSNRAAEGYANRDIECCMVVNTADYCTLTSGQLCESIQKILGDSSQPEYAEMVSMEHEQNEFRGARNEAIGDLISYLSEVLEPAFQNMANMPWAMHEMVGDHSKYVDEISEILQANIPKYAENLTSEIPLKLLYQKLVEWLIPKFSETINQGCKKITNDGVQQLLLDTGALRATLNHIPKYGNKEATALFKRYIAKEMAKVEDLLRTLMSNDLADPKRMVEVFKEYMKHNKDLGIADFEKVVELTGFRKQEQAALVEQLKRDLKREAS